MRELLAHRRAAGILLRKALLCVLGWALLFAVGTCVARVLDLATACAVLYLLCGNAWMQGVCWLVDQADRREP